MLVIRERVAAHPSLASFGPLPRMLVAQTQQQRAVSITRTPRAGCVSAHVRVQYTYEYTTAAFFEGRLTIFTYTACACWPRYGDVLVIGRVVMSGHRAGIVAMLYQRSRQDVNTQNTD